MFLNKFTIFAPNIDFVLHFFLKKRNRPRLERPVPTSFLYTKKEIVILIFAPISVLAKTNASPMLN